MSSSGKTYFVVAYDHDKEEFVLDNDMADSKFEHDTWDTVEEEWCYLDNNLDMGESLKELTDRLKEKFNDD